MRIVAILSCRNEAAYLPTCLHYLVNNEIEFAVVDNDSTDDSLDIIHSAEFRPHLLGLKKVPFDGIFQLKPMLEAKMWFVENIPTDWVLHISPDEIPHSNREGTTLLDEVKCFDKNGFNVVNFNEFVFLPLTEPWVEGLCGWPIQKHYYFYESWRFQQPRLWKKGQGFSIIQYAGHMLNGGNLQYAPESLVLRHYIFRNQEHAYNKYTSRRFAEASLARGWHLDRHGFAMENFKFPNADKLESLERADSFALSRSRPWQKHYWEF